jgi:hypothetical protein
VVLKQICKYLFYLNVKCILLFSVYLAIFILLKFKDDSPTEDNQHTCENQDKNMKKTLERIKNEYHFPTMPVVELKNGLRVANFNSPHGFSFEDGNQLSSCCKKRCSVLLEALDEYIDNGKFIDVKKGWAMGFDLAAMIQQANQQAEEDGIDVIIAPLPVLQAAKKSADFFELDLSRFRTGYLVNRYDKIHSITKFCIV